MGQFRIGIAGAGRMGGLHAKICSGMPEVEISAVCDTDEDVGRAAAEKYGCAWCGDYRELSDTSDAVIVAVPTALHREVGEFFLRKGMPVLIEKPIAATTKEADALINASESSGAVLQIGHIERFNPAVVAISDMVGSPRFIECSRVSPFPFRSTDVCVVLDLMIHDIDIALHLAGSEVISVSAVGVKVLTAAEDIANARIVFENGCVANVTASRVSVKKERQIRIFQSDSYISLDYEENRAKVYTRRAGSESVDISSLDAEQLGDPLQFVLANLIEVREVDVQLYNPLEREIDSFVKCIRSQGTPVVTGRQGRAALEVAETIRRSILSEVKEC